MVDSLEIVAAISTMNELMLDSCIDHLIGRTNFFFRLLLSDINFILVGRCMNEYISIYQYFNLVFDGLDFLLQQMYSIISVVNVSVCEYFLNRNISRIVDVYFENCYYRSIDVSRCCRLSGYCDCDCDSAYCPGCHRSGYCHRRCGYHRIPWSLHPINLCFRGFLFMILIFFRLIYWFCICIIFFFVQSLLFSCCVG